MNPSNANGVNRMPSVNEIVASDDAKDPYLESY